MYLIICIFPKAHAWLLVHLPSLTHSIPKRLAPTLRANCHIQTRHITAIFFNWSPAILCWVVFGDGMPLLSGFFPKGIQICGLCYVIEHPPVLWTAWGSGCVQDGVGWSGCLKRCFSSRTAKPLNFGVLGPLQSEIHSTSTVCPQGGGHKILTCHHLTSFNPPTPLHHRHRHQCYRLHLPPF